MSRSTIEGSQEFHKGDWVQIAKDLGPGMRHFTADCEAIVIGSYNDQYGGGNINSYTLHLKGRGQTSWYYENQLTLIEKDRSDKLAEWEAAEKAEHKEKGDLDWIFAHGDEVLKSAHGATIAALAECFGLTNLWGNHGEGLVYYENALKTLALAEPFIRAGDKDGWLAMCATLIEGKANG